MPAVSNAMKGLKRSGIREVMDLAAKESNVIHLEVGEPLFQTPSHISTAAYESSVAGYTKYTPNNGLLSLRNTISSRLNEDYGLNVTADNIIITVGAVGAISTAIRAIVDHGDEILIPDPGWPNYEMMIHCAGAIPKHYLLSPESGYLPSLNDIEKLVTPKTKGIVINSPSNPLGTIIPDKLIKEIVDFAYRKNIFVISDEVYEKIVFDCAHNSALKHDKYGCVISAFSFSKTYAMTGWRVGYAVASTEVSSIIGKLQEAYVSCACSISQKAAEAAILSSQACVNNMVSTYHNNLSLAINILDEYGMDYHTPSGAFYMWIKVPSSDSTAFAKMLLTEKKIAVAPGATFGPSGQGHIRISLASPQDSIQEGLNAIGNLVTSM